MNYKDTVSIYRNRSSGRLRIQPFGRLANGSSQPFGEQVVLPIATSDDQLLKAIVDNLDKNNKQHYKRQLAPKVSDDEWRRELKKDQLISVERQGRTYRLVPSKQMGNGFGSIDNMIRTYLERDFLQQGGKLVRELFGEIP
jgi:predicted secreted protein